MDVIEAKQDRRKRRKEQLDNYLQELHQKDISEGFSVLCNDGSVRKIKKISFFERRSMEFAELARDARMGKYSDADIGKKFRKLIENF